MKARRYALPVFPRVRAAALAVALLGIAATAGMRPAAATPTEAPTPALTEARSASTAPPLAWKRCHKSFECATLMVPVDYTRPDGDHVGIALVRSRALGRNRSHPTLVVNFGGPGDAGTETLPYFVDALPDEIRRAFDIVSFDPRGVGSSKPIRCISAADADTLYAADPTADGAAELPAFYDGTAWPVDLEQGCIDRNGSWLAAVGTRNVARDLDQVRNALGNDTLDFLGFSYGTVIAAVYAQMYPERVGRFVLDSPVNLSVTPEQELIDDANGFEHALDSFLADCAARAKCSEHGDPTTALRKLQVRFEQGLTLQGDTLAGGKRRVAVGDFYTALISALYDKEFGWPDLAAALHDATAHKDGRMLQALADSYNGRRPNGTYDNISQVIGVILCDDRFDATPSFAAFVALHDQLAAAYPFLGGYAGSTPLGCDPRLPRPPVSEQLGDVRVANAPPALVIGTTDDPATPYSGAQDTNERWDGSRLLTFVSTEHTSYLKSACVDAAVDAYLLRGRLPAAGTRCKR
jgi:pimeloyl-ACP methyl ester carboxylesterase